MQILGVRKKILFNAKESETLQQIILGSCGIPVRKVKASISLGTWKQFFLMCASRGEFCKLCFFPDSKMQVQYKIPFELQECCTDCYSNVAYTFKKCDWINQHSIISKCLILSWFCLTFYSASVLASSRKIKKPIPLIPGKLAWRSICTRHGKKGFQQYAFFTVVVAK